MKLKIIFLSLSLVLICPSSQAKIITQGGTMGIGDFQLTGYFEVTEGEVSLSKEKRTVFTPGASIRGKLGNSILRKAKLFELDMQFVDFQTSN